MSFIPLQGAMMLKKLSIIRNPVFRRSGTCQGRRTLLCQRNLLHRQWCHQQLQWWLMHWESVSLCLLHRMRLLV